MALRRGVVAFSLAMLLGHAPLADADVADYLGKTVTAVSVQSDGRTLSDSRVVSVVETAVGHALSMRDVRESVVHLFSLGQYEDVRVHASLSGAGVALVYEVVPMNLFQAVTFAGANEPGINEGRLRRMLVERFGQTPSVSRAPDMALAVELALHDNGYLRARVTPHATGRPAQGRMALTLAVVVGPRAHLGAVTVEGMPDVATAELRSRLEIGAGLPYEPERLVGRIDRYVAELRKRGYYEARLSMVPSFSEDGRTVDVRLTASQGQLVRIVFGGDPVPADRRDELVPVAREGSADEDLLEDSSNRIEEFFRTQGYRDASAPFSRDSTGAELVVTFTVRKGAQYRVESVEVIGASAIATDEIASKLRVRAGQPFSAAVLDADVRQIEGFYRLRGFTTARAEAVTEPAGAAGQHVGVALRIEVTENTQMMVNSVSIEGNQSVPEAELRELLSLVPGRPFSAAALALDRDAVELQYANLGYQAVAVEARPGLSADAKRADVVLVIREGARFFVDHVLISGNRRTKTAAIERELRLKAGDPLGLEAISESQRQLAALGLFRRAHITQLGRSSETTRDVLVTLEEAPLTTVGYGGGFEVRRRVVPSAEDPTVASEKIEFAPRASFEVGRRNLFGTNRSVNMFSSASLHPRDTPGTTSAGAPVTGDGYLFPDYRVVGQFRQARFRGSNVDFRVIGTAEQQIRSSFDFSRRSVAADLSVRLPSSLSVSGGYQIQRTRVFNQTADVSQQADIDRLFPKVRLSSFLGSIARDTRNDPVEPSTGHFLSANGQFAARVIGSEVGFVKTFLTAQTFKALGARRIIFAASARLGAASGFAKIDELPASERFFAGGDTTHRGFALARLGVRHSPPREEDTIDAGGFPLGGNGLLLFNGELRMPVKGGVKVVSFADLGNVFKTASDVSFSELRPGLGVGFRYKSPVGPLRFDIGLKVPRRADESRTAWSITFGEAF